MTVLLALQAGAHVSLSHQSLRDRNRLVMPASCASSAGKSKGGHAALVWSPSESYSHPAGDGNLRLACLQPMDGTEDCLAMRVPLGQCGFEGGQKLLRQRRVVALTSQLRDQKFLFRDAPLAFDDVLLGLCEVSLFLLQA